MNNATLILPQEESQDYIQNKKVAIIAAYKKVRLRKIIRWE